MSKACETAAPPPPCILILLPPHTLHCLRLSAVQGNPTYKKLYSNLETGLTSATTSPIYQKAKDTVWPVAEPVAGPLYDNFARSKYLAQLADHLKPKIA